jgi:hypothetical protein
VEEEVHSTGKFGRGDKRGVEPWNQMGRTVVPALGDVLLCSCLARLSLSALDRLCLSFQFSCAITIAIAIATATDIATATATIAEPLACLRLPRSVWSIAPVLAEITDPAGTRDSSPHRTLLYSRNRA